MAVHVPRQALEGGPRDLKLHASWFEEVILSMADDFQVPLHEVIPVRVFHEGETSSGRSYYNRLTRSIVLGGPVDRAAFVHEVSHHFAHCITGKPPYWADQALAEYMEDYILQETQTSRHLIRRMALAEDGSEVLSHLTRSAVDEGRGWGLMVVRYLFEDRWARRTMGEKIRLLLGLSEAELSGLAPAVLEYCRRPDLLAGSGPTAR